MTTTSKIHLVLPVIVFFILAMVPFAKAQTTDLNNSFQQRLDKIKKEYEFPGATAAYVLPNGETGVVATGIADVRTNKLMSSESRMLAASIGKTFVSATIVALVHEKQLSLDDPISNWLGDQAWFSRLPNHSTITVRHLLNHSSGLPNHVKISTFRRAAARKWHGAENPFPPSALVAFVLDQPPLFEAGKGWAYSDTGFILLGMIIESISGEDFFDLIMTRFIRPLKLEQTTPSNHIDLPDLATGYMSNQNPFGLPSETINSHGVMAWNPGIEWTGGGLVSSSRDLAVWGAALFGGRALDYPYLHELLAGVQIDPLQPGVSYGLGVAIHQGGQFGPVYGHGGWIPGYSSSLRYYAKYRVSIAFQINTDVGVIDDSTSVIKALELGLAELVIGAVD